MYCKNCGAQLYSGQAQCPACGTWNTQAGGVPNYGGSYPGGENSLPAQYRPLSPWAYFGYSLLFAIPIVGFILLIVFSFSDENINRRNYARSFWCALLLAVIIIVVLAVTGLLGAVFYGARY